MLFDDDVSNQLIPMELEDLQIETYQEEEEEMTIPLSMHQMMNEAVGEAGLTNYEQLLQDGEEAANLIQEFDGEEAEALMEELSMTVGFRKRKKTRAKVNKTLAPHLLEKLGQANMYYVQGDFDGAVNELHEVIKEAPNALQAWSTLAILYEEKAQPGKAMQAYLIAAHLSKDPELWNRLGNLSKQVDLIDQAIYCFTKAIRLDASDADALWHRSGLYLQQGQMEKAIIGFETILQMMPHTMYVIKELAKVYLEIGETCKGISLFESALEADITEPLEQEEGFDGEVIGEISLGEHLKVKARVGYEELNMLCELYIEEGEFEKLISTLKTAVYRLHGKPFTDGDIVAEFQLPIALVVKLGVAYLNLGESDTAERYFKELYECSVEPFAELYHDVIDAFMMKRKFSSALSVLEIVRSQMENPFTLTKMARCYQELAQFEKALDLFQQVLDYDTENLDVRVAIAQIYAELGEDNTAQEMFDQIYNIDMHLSENNNEMEAEATEENSLLKSKRILRDRVVAKAKEQARIKENLETFKIIKDMKMGGESRRAEMMFHIRKLLLRFERAKELFPAVRKKLYHVTKEGKKNIGEVEDDEVTDKTMKSFHQGLTFEEWYDLHVDFAMAAALENRHEDAQSALRTAFEANVFYHHPTLSLHLKLLMIACAMHANDYYLVSDLVRWIFQRFKHSNLSMDLYCLFFADKIEAISHFGARINHKYFVRLIKSIEQYESSLFKVAPTANIYLVFGHLYIVARGYIHAIHYYLKAYKMNPKNPLVHLCLGICFIHRAIQRQAGSRHTLILQGVAFLCQYEELRGPCPESFYNLGRAFHQIGLSTLALKYYQKVLETDSPFKQIAAYNLSMIYVNSGSGFLAQQLLRQHCTV